MLSSRVRALWIGHLCAIFLAACSRPDAVKPVSEPPASVAPVISISEDATAAAARVGVKLRAVVEESVHDVERLLDVGRVDIRVMVGPRRSISSRGDGGYTDPASGTVKIWLDPGFRDFRWTLSSSMPLTVAHELHHSARVQRGPGYGATLRQAIVTEGLADMFSLEVYPRAARPPWTSALPRQSLCKWWERASKEFMEGRSYDHSLWFFGRGERVPRWTGYTLGYELVEAYLAEQPTRSAAELVDVEAATVIEDSRFCMRPGA